MGKDLEEHRQQGCLTAHTQTHEHIADLGGGGEGHHGGDPAGEDGADGACHHAGDAEQQQHGLYAACGKNLRADDTVDDLDEQKDIALGHHAGENTGGGRCCPPIGIGHPEMEGEQTALDGQPCGHQADSRRHGKAVGTLRPQRLNGLVELGKQQMSRDGVGVDHADEEQSRADKRKHHVAHGGNERPAALTDAQQGTGGDGADLNEHIAGKNIVGIAQRHQCHMRQIHHDPVQVLLAAGDVAFDVFAAAADGEQDHDDKHQRHQRLDDTGGNLVAPRGRIVAHHVGEADMARSTEYQQVGLHIQAGAQQEIGEPFAPAGRHHEGDHGAQQAQHNGEERIILHKAHARPPFRRLEIMR